MTENPLRTDIAVVVVLILPQTDGSFITSWVPPWSLFGGLVTNELGDAEAGWRRCSLSLR